MKIFDPHVHIGTETAIYLIKGRVETRFGEGLTESVINESGDFIYIPAALPHQPVNRVHERRSVVGHPERDAEAIA